MRYETLLTSVAFIALSCPSTPLYSAETISNENYIEEIIVTARKREEATLKSPVSIAVFSQEDIEKAGIVDVQDLAMQTPGFSYREGFGRILSEGNNRPVMRGMSSVMGEANAAFFVDGVYVAGPISTFDLKNLARVEAIKGPQSALFGRGAFGGAVNFITRRPSDEFEAKIESIYGRFNHIELDGYVAGPIGDGASAELNARIMDRGGVHHNKATQERDLGAQSSFRIGGKLNLDPSEALNIYVQGGWAKDTDSGYAYSKWNGGEPRDEGISDGKHNCYQPDIFMSMFGMNFTNSLSRGYYCGEITSPQSFYGDFGGLNSVERETANVIGTLTYQLAGGASLTSLTGYTDIAYSQAELPADYPGASVIWEKGGQSYFSQEVRYASKAEQRLRYLVGLYYFKSNSGDSVNVAFNPLTTTLDDSENPLSANDGYIDNKAVFASFDYDLTGSLMLSTEIRYQRENKVLDGDLYDGLHKLTFDAWLPRVALTWQVNDTVMLYANAAKGNKPGGFNDNFFKVSLDDTDRQFWRDLGRGTYDESTVWSYEAGIKSSFNDTFSVNASLYYIDWSAQQLTQSDALKRAGSTRQTTVTFIKNAGKSEIKGFEIDLNWQVSEALNLRAAYAFSDSQFKDYLDENWRDLQDTNGWYSGQAIAAAIFPGGDTSLTPDLLPSGIVLDTSKDPVDADGDGSPDRYFVIDTVDPDGQVVGNSLPQSPKHQLSLSATYRVALKDNIFGFIRGDYLYESKRYVQAANLAYVGGSSLANLRIGVEDMSWSLTVFVDNLFENDTPEVATRYLDMGQVLMIPSQVRSGSRYTFGRDFTMTASEPRTFGLNFTKRF